MKYTKEIIKIVAKIVLISEKNIDKNTNSENEPRWDSIAHVRVILEIEKKYKIKIDTSLVEDLRSIKNINDYLERKII